MKKIKKSVWLSYDLDLIAGDFKGLFELLDSLDAKECGECLAFFKIEVSSEENFESELKQLIEKHVDLTEEDRIYIIFSKEENGKKKTVGKFLFGRRKKSPPWKGYAAVDVGEEEG